MSSESLNSGRPTYERFLLLLLGEVIVGFFLYGTFTFMPTAVQMVTLSLQDDKAVEMEVLQRR
jgi:hypothetical protein